MVAVVGLITSAASPAPALPTVTKAAGVWLKDFPAAKIVKKKTRKKG
jgi:hypothetical protein